jgi:uncharacterized RDD family membrane protein YckC
MLFKENTLDASQIIQQSTSKPIAKNYVISKVTKLTGFVIDVSILGSIILLFRQFPHLTPYNKDNTTNAVVLSFVLFYFPLLEYFYGKTIGKVITKSSVVRKDGRKITFFQALIRGFLRLAPANFVLSLNKKPISFHDRLSGTIVVKDDFLEHHRAYHQ